MFWVSCEKGNRALLFSLVGGRLSPNHGDATELLFRVDKGPLGDWSWYYSADLASAGESADDERRAGGLLRQMLNGDTLRVQFTYISGANGIARFALRGLAEHLTTNRADCGSKETNR